MKRLASSLLCIAALALTLAGAGPSRPAGHVVEVGFRSVAISGKLRLAVYLPPGYDHSGLRYPVVYFLHGLPARATAYRGIDFLRRALDQSGRGALVVAPQGARPGDTGPEYLEGARNARASAHTFVTSLRSAFARRPTFFAFYVGRGDDRFRDENELLHRQLAAARVPHVFQIYPGGHQQSVWTVHARAWLELALDRLLRAHG